MLTAILVHLGAILTPTLVVVLVLGYVMFKNPDKAKIWGSYIYKILRWIKQENDKRYTQLDIEGRVNQFSNTVLSKNIKNFEPPDVKIKWVEGNDNESAFLLEGELIIRMRKSRNNNQNFINATLYLVSQCVLRKTKPYISKSQKEALDLFITRDILKKQKSEVLEQFNIDYLSNKLKDNDKINNLFEKFYHIDNAGYFFPVLMQELHFLGVKIFSSTFKKDAIYKEVNNLIDFLYSRSQTEERDTNTPLDFLGRYCRFGIMIIGNIEKIYSKGERPYVERMRFLEDNLKLETVYVLGDIKKKDFIQEVCVQIYERYNFSVYTTRGFRGMRTISDNRKVYKDSFLVILRSDVIDDYITDDEYTSSIS